RPVVGLEAVVLLDRDPRQRLPLPGELIAAACELLLLCQQRGARGQPLRARPDDLAHDPISVEGDPPGSVSPGTLAGDTATQIPRATRATAKTSASRGPRGRTFSTKITTATTAIQQRLIPPSTKRTALSPP